MNTKKSPHHEPIIGIDTIKFGFPVSSQQMNLNKWTKTEWSTVEEDDDKLFHLQYIKKIELSNRAKITLKYLPYDFRGRSFNLLLIEFSFPKLIFGQNYQNVKDWSAALNCANFEISRIHGIPRLRDIRDATIYRIDLCANLKVGEGDLGDYLQVISKAKHPHRETKPYLGQGVVFPSKEVRTSFYDKGKECGEVNARGTLRMEVQLLSKRVIGKWVKMKRPTLHLINQYMIAELLLREIHVLHLDHQVICEELLLVSKLSKVYTNRRVQSMLGYWLRKRTSGPMKMKRNGYTRRAICHYEKLFQQAGVSSNSTDCKKTIPALTKFFPDIDEICNKPLSDTRDINTVISQKEA